MPTLSEPHTEINSRGAQSPVRIPVTRRAEDAASKASREDDPKMVLRDVNFFYGKSQALFTVNIDIQPNQVTAFIGPSGCGKSTLLRCLNRMNDLIEGTRLGAGTIRIHGVDIHQPSVDVIELRKRVGMVFQKSNPFPKSIYENITYGLRLQGLRDRASLDETVEKSLRGAALWDEVKDRLHTS